MKSVTIRQVYNDFSAVLALLAQGEEVAVLDRTRPVARICPSLPKAPANFKMPDFAACAKAVSGDSRLMTNIILEEQPPLPRPPVRPNSWFKELHSQSKFLAIFITHNAAMADSVLNAL